ncbi:hypothetical protein V4D02_27460, partial [Klebsiella pneumoniae]|uniref:hypothetical protein n=1 Tax=Klebsiella pneumoniae TaxID=573 RepID=UPI003F8E441A
WHLTTRLNSSPGAAKQACLVDSVVKKTEQCFIMDGVLPTLATVVLTYFDHDSFTIQGYSKQSMKMTETLNEELQLVSEWV